MPGSETISNLYEIFKQTKRQSNGIFMGFEDTIDRPSTLTTQNRLVKISNKCPSTR